MELYDGGSNKDESIFSETGNSVPSPVKSFGNQMFIKFKTEGAGIDKGFTLNISFGSRTNC